MYMLYIYIYIYVCMHRTGLQCVALLTATAKVPLMAEDHRQWSHRQDNQNESTKEKSCTTWLECVEIVKTTQGFKATSKGVGVVWKFPLARGMQKAGAMANTWLQSLYLYSRGKWLLVLTSCRRAQFVPVASLLEVSFSLQIFNLRAEIGDETQPLCNSVTVTISNLQVDMFAVACFT